MWASYLIWTSIMLWHDFVSNICAAWDQHYEKHQRNRKNEIHVKQHQCRRRVINIATNYLVVWRGSANDKQSALISRQKPAAPCGALAAYEKNVRSPHHRHVLIIITNNSNWYGNIIIL